MKQLLFLAIMWLPATRAQAQNNDCKVLSDSLKGVYEGGCRNGKADGAGKASGAHAYSGEFKNGLPDGKGKYTWPNGDVYEGGFKKGLKEGYGELHRPSSHADSLLTGFWKKDVYKGKYEKPYIVHNTTSNISRVEVNKTGDGEKTITVSVMLLAGGGSLGTRNNQTVVRMSDVQVSKGLFIYKSNTTISNKDVTTFRGVDFPFRAKFFFGSSIVEIEFFEPGEWDVMVPIL